MLVLLLLLREKADVTPAAVLARAAAVKRVERGAMLVVIIVVIDGVSGCRRQTADERQWDWSKSSQVLNKDEGIPTFSLFRPDVAIRDL